VDRRTDGLSQRERLDAVERAALAAMADARRAALAMPRAALFRWSAFEMHMRMLDCRLVLTAFRFARPMLKRLLAPALGSTAGALRRYLRDKVPGPGGGY
jgi:hypothetical protein